MKTLKVLIFFSAFAVLLIIVPSVAMIIESMNDPIEKSWIINSLEIETDIVPSEDMENEAKGEIIFDPSFNEKQLKLGKSKDEYFKSLKKEDARWHLTKYTIKKNESLWTIAKKFNINHSMLINLNSFPDPDMVKAGTVIDVPSKQGVVYKISKGDTLSEIAKKYRVEIKKIAAHNNIKKGHIIAGNEIFIPGAVELNQKTATDKTRVVKKENMAESKKPDKKTSEIDPHYIAAKEVKENNNKKIVLSWPLKGPITSGFGYRTHPFSGEKKFHSGLDIGAEEGTTVSAAGNGKVIFEGWKDVYGKMIVIAHDNNYITVYAHNSENLVKLNDVVKRGEPIARSGKTGAVTGAHLHFEIRKGIVPLNPLRVLK